MRCYRRTLPHAQYQANGEGRWYGGKLWLFDEPGDLADAPSFREERGSSNERWTDGKNVVGLTANRNCLKAGRVPAALYDAFLEARKAVEPKVEEAGRIGNTTKRRRRYSDEGDEVNIDRYMTGDPNFWERRKRGKKKRVIRIGISYSDHWGARERDYVSRAAAAAATVDALTALGYGTEVWGYSTGRVCDGRMDQGQEYTTAVRLKASDQPLDVPKVLTTGLTAMSRRFTFGVYEHEGCGPEWNSTCDGLSKTMKAELDLDVLLGDEASSDFDPELVELMAELRKGAHDAARDPKWQGRGAQEEADAFGQGLGALEDLEAEAQEGMDGEGEGADAEGKDAEAEGAEQGEDLEGGGEEGADEGGAGEGLEGMEAGAEGSDAGLGSGQDFPPPPPRPRHSHQKDEGIDWTEHGFGWAGIN